MPRKRSKIVTNMDGLEWKRSKFSRPVQKFLKYAEKLAIKNSDLLIADSIGIKEYLKGEYHVDSLFIPYGADEIQSTDSSYLAEYNLKKNEFFLIIARLEPENNIQTIINGVLKSSSSLPIVIVGKKSTNHALELIAEYSDEDQVHFLGGIYEKAKLDALRMHCKLYFHGHSVGGTNPSLLEAMACSSLICAHQNPFNKYVLESDGCYFSNSDEIHTIVDNMDTYLQEKWRINNIEKIRTTYSWEAIINAYEKAFKEILD